MKKILKKQTKARTLVVGDIHGGKKALQQVLIRASFDVEKDKIIFLGDYVDGWGESAETIDILIGIKNKANFVGNGDNIIFIRGNHDKWCEEWLLTGVQKRMWVEQGGRATLESYVSTGLLTEDSHKDFFRNLHNYYVDDKNRGFVHGGFTSSKGLGHESHQTNYYWDRTLIQNALSFRKRWLQYPQDCPKILRTHDEVYVGHTSTLFWNYDETFLPEGMDKAYLGEPIITPIHVCNVWDLDTGGGYNGKLTIMDVDTKEYWQSDLLKTLYPNELGR